MKKSLIFFSVLFFLASCEKKEELQFEFAPNAAAKEIGVISYKIINQTKDLLRATIKTTSADYYLSLNNYALESNDIYNIQLQSGKQSYKVIWDAHKNALLFESPSETIEVSQKLKLESSKMYAKNLSRLQAYEEIIKLMMESSNDIMENMDISNDIQLKQPTNRPTKNLGNLTTVERTRAGLSRNRTCYNAWQDAAVACSNSFCIGCETFVAGTDGVDCDCLCLVDDYFCACTAVGVPCEN